MRVYYDRDADLNLIKGKKVVIVGYGSQGHAHALNLKDSGVKEVAIALRKGSASAKKAEAAGFKVMEVADAAKWADLVMMLTPDELQGDIYREHLHDNMKKGSALVFAHGLNVHFNLLDPRADLDVLVTHIQALLAGRDYRAVMLNGVPFTPSIVLRALERMNLPSESPATGASTPG